MMKNSPLPFRKLLKQSEDKVDEGENTNKIDFIMRNSPMPLRKFLNKHSDDKSEDGNNKEESDIKMKNSPIRKFLNKHSEDKCDDGSDGDNKSVKRSESQNSRQSSTKSNSNKDVHTQYSFKKSNSYELVNSLEDIRDVGQLRVHLIHCRGLYAADFNGKSDPYAVIRLNDTEFRSRTIKKTVNPEWRENFVFHITDITDILYITIYDEDRFNDSEFLGRVAIPLLSITDEHDQIYGLKDRRYELRAKGNHPQIVLRFDLHWNKVRAALETIRRPPETRTISFKRTLFIANVQRMRKVLHFLKSFSDYMQSCFSWESPSRSIKAFVLFELLVYYFEPYMIPLLVLAFIFIYPIYASDMITDWLDPYSSLEHSNDDQDDDSPDNESVPKKNLSEMYKAIQEVSAYVQNTLGQLASNAERVKNVVNFSTPFMSWLAVLFLIIMTFILYWIPFRLLIMLYGVNKFAKKLLRPNHVPHSEILSFLSRVPDDPTLKKCHEISTQDPLLLKLEEEERLKKEGSTKLVKRVSSLFQKERTSKKD